jgi:hypothetical protein
LQRRRPQRRNALAGESRVAVEVDQDVDAVVAYPLCRLGIGVVADIVPMIDRLDDASAFRALIIRPVGICEHGDAIPIVPLEQLDDQGCKRMLSEIRR